MLRYPNFANSAASRQGCSKRSPLETTRRSTPAARTSGSLCMAAKDPSSAKTSRSQSDSGLSEPLARDPSNQTDETEGYRLVREPRYSQSARCSIAHPFYPRTALRDRVVGIPGSMEHNGTYQDLSAGRQVRLGESAACRKRRPSLAASGISQQNPRAMSTGRLLMSKPNRLAHHVQSYSQCVFCAPGRTQKL